MAGLRINIKNVNNSSNAELPKYKAGSKHKGPSSLVGSGGTALQGRQEAKGLSDFICSSIKHTSAGMVSIDKLITGFCLPLDSSIECLLFYVNQVRALHHLFRLWHI